MAIPDDPYFAGRIRDEPVKGKPFDAGGRALVLSWAVVFAANLIVPGFLGWMVTREGGKLGMLIGTILVFALGCRACFVSRRAMLTVVYGGWVVAASQLFPFLQMLAGMMGVEVAVALGQATDERLPDVVTISGGVVATMFVGFALIAAALAFGAACRGIASIYYRGPILDTDFEEGKA